MQKKQKILIFFLLVIHFILLTLTISGKLNFFFNDATLRKGKAADFFAVYQAGNNFLNKISIYQDTEGISTPYSFPFRYLPFLAYTVGAISNIFTPFQAYFIHIIINELLLIFNIYIISQISRNFKVFIVSIIPWLFFSPFLIELYMGQWSFLLTCLLFYTIIAFLKDRKFLQLAYIFAPLIKPNALIITPLLIKMKKYKLLIFTFLSIILTSVFYFLFYKNDFSLFLNNFQDSWYSHGGNFGFKSLYYIIFIRYLNIPLPRLWYYMIISILLGYTIYLTYKCRKMILCFSIWICFYFFIYKDVWEHHFVLIIPVFSLIFSKFNLNLKKLKEKSNILLLISFLLIALPSLFVFQYLFNSASVQEPDDYNPIYVILYHLQKLIGVLFLYIWTAKKIFHD